MLKKSVSIFLVFLFTLSPFQPLFAMDRFEKLRDESINSDGSPRYIGYKSPRNDPRDHTDDVIELADIDGSIKEKPTLYVKTSDGRFIPYEPESNDNSSEEDFIRYIHDGEFISCESFLNSGDPYTRKALFAAAIVFEMVHRGLQVGVHGLNAALWVVGFPMKAQEIYIGLKLVGGLLLIPAAFLIPFTDMMKNFKMDFGFDNATTSAFLFGYQNSSVDINFGGTVGTGSLPEVPLPSIPLPAPVSVPLPFFPVPASAPVSSPVAAPQVTPDLEQDFNINLPIELNIPIDIQIAPFNKTSYGINIDPGFASVFEIIGSGVKIYIASFVSFWFVEKAFNKLVISKERPRFFEEMLRGGFEKKISELKKKIFHEVDEKEDEQRRTMGSILRSPFFWATFPTAQLAGSVMISIGVFASWLNNWHGFSETLDFSTESATTNLSSVSFNNATSFSMPFAKFYTNASGNQESGVDANFKFSILLYLMLDGLAHLDYAQTMVIAGAFVFMYGLTGQIVAAVVR